MATKIFTTYSFQDSNKITNLAAPTAGSSDAATAQYVDDRVSAAQQGLDVKVSVYLATTVEITIPTISSAVSSLSIDSIAINFNDENKRILVKNQTAKQHNGIYEVKKSGTDIYLTRTADASDGKLTANAFTFVENGTSLKDTGWVLTNNDPIVVGTTELVWTQFSTAGVFSASDGIYLDGLTFKLNLNANGGLIITDSKLLIDLKSNSGLGTDSDGLFVDLATNSGLKVIEQTNAAGGLAIDNVSVAQGGTGATTAVGALVNLGAVGKFSVNLNDTTPGVVSITDAGKTFTISHPLRTGFGGTSDVFVCLQEISSKQIVIADVEVASATQVIISFGSAPTSNGADYRVVIIG